MQWRCGQKTFHLKKAPLLMGIVNVTPDSFSDGGFYDSPAKAIAHGVALAEDGADIIDVGGESTRPGAEPVNEDNEKRRVLPIVEKLAKANITVSVDTMKPAVMYAALESGATILNDVNGFNSNEAIKAVGNAACGLVVMHKLGNPQTMQQNPQYGDVVDDIQAFLAARQQKLIAAGVASERLCFDPGIGFGKTLAHNVRLLNNLPRFSLGKQPVLVGVSRKSLFYTIAPNASLNTRDIISAKAAALLAIRGADILRVHNVKMTKQALAVVELLDDTTHAHHA